MIVALARKPAQLDKAPRVPLLVEQKRPGILLRFRPGALLQHPYGSATQLGEDRVRTHVREPIERIMIITLAAVHQRMPVRTFGAPDFLHDSVSRFQMAVQPKRSGSDEPVVFKLREIAPIRFFDAPADVWFRLAGTHGIGQARWRRIK